jgi:P-type Cu+ transporter
VIDLSGKGENEILRLTAIAEAGSEHSLIQAVVNHAKEKGISVTNLESFEAVSGHGLKAVYRDHDILIGNRKLINDNRISITEKTEQVLTELEMKVKLQYWFL